MTLLIAGLPGTGKSTLVLEFCYRTAMAKGKDHLRSLYVTTEGHAPWLIEHARGFGWDTDTKAKVRILSDKDAKSPVQIRSLKTQQDLSEFLAAIDKEDVKDHANKLGRGHALQRTLHEFLVKLHGTIPQHSIGPETSSIGEIAPKKSVEDRSAPQGRSIDSLPLCRLADLDVLVFDNLNTMPVDKSLWFKLLSDLGSTGPRLVVVILDAAHTGHSAESWEYLADTVIRMDHASPGGYMIRTIEIVKSRYQLSALGKHQVKVQKAYLLGKKEIGGKASLVKAGGQTIAQTDLPLLMRHHPFREEGGIFIYPSMHFVLSRHKYLHPLPATKRLPAEFAEVGDLLGGGFRAGRCVALAGGSGTHKSRLAFIQLLSTLHKNRAARGIIISLGEDESTMLDLLGEIQREQFASYKHEAVADIAGDGRLEIAYYPPGFITPRSSSIDFKLVLPVTDPRRGLTPLC